MGSWDPVDRARDGRHAGIRTHAAFAAAMVEAMERADGGRPDEIRAAAPSPQYPTPTWTARPLSDRLPQSVRGTITAMRLRRRIRAMRRRDPFIY